MRRAARPPSPPRLVAHLPIAQHLGTAPGRSPLGNLNTQLGALLASSVRTSPGEAAACGLNALQALQVAPAGLGGERCLWPASGTLCCRRWPHAYTRKGTLFGLFPDHLEDGTTPRIGAHVARHECCLRPVSLCYRGDDDGRCAHLSIMSRQDMGRMPHDLRRLPAIRVRTPLDEARSCLRGVPGDRNLGKHLRGGGQRLLQQACEGAPDEDAVKTRGHHPRTARWHLGPVRARKHACAQRIELTRMPGLVAASVGESLRTRCAPVASMLGRARLLDYICIWSTVILRRCPRPLSALCIACSAQVLGRAAVGDPRLPRAGATDRGQGSAVYKSSEDQLLEDCAQALLRSQYCQQARQTGRKPDASKQRLGRARRMAHPAGGRTSSSLMPHACRACRGPQCFRRLASATAKEPWSPVVFAY